MHFFAIWCLSVLVRALCKPTMRSALLCEAHKRLDRWFEGGVMQLGSVHEREGTELRFAKSDDSCGGANAPIMFMNYSLANVSPIHVFTAIADIESQKEWYTSLRSAKTLNDPTGRAQGARGARIQYISPPAIPDRILHEWEAYAKSQDGSEYWFASSTNLNGPIQSWDTSGQSSDSVFALGGPVEVQNCLCAHHIRATPTGVYAIVTNQINSHPPFGIPQDWVSQLTWGISLDFINQLKKRAVWLAGQKNRTLWQPPADMMSSQQSNSMSTCETLWKILEENDEHVEKDHHIDPRVGAPALVSQHLLFGVVACMVLCITVSVAVAMRVSDQRSSDVQELCIQEGYSDAERTIAEDRGSFLGCGCFSPRPPRKNSPQFDNSPIYLLEQPAKPRADSRTMRAMGLPS